jgi:acetyl-CoA carboxylase biotin carboxylase subunit
VYRPAAGPGIRIDSGVFQGARVPVFYDPMVAKLVVWGRDRGEAIERLRRALSEFVVKGIKTSMPFHQKVVNHPVFLAGNYDTGFIDQHMAGGKGGAAATSAEDAAEARRVAFMMAAIVAYKRDKERAAKATAATNAGGGDPWKTFGRRAQMRGGWR